MNKKIEMTDIFDFETLEKCNKLLNLLGTETKRVKGTSIVRFDTVELTKEANEIYEVNDDFVPSANDIVYEHCYLDTKNISHFFKAKGETTKVEGVMLCTQSGAWVFVTNITEEEILMYWCNLDLKLNR